MIAWEMPRYIDSGRAECQMSPGPSDDDEDQESTLQPSSCTRRSRDLWYVHPTTPRSMMSMIKFRGWRWFREAPIKFTQAIFGHCPSGLKNCSVSTNQNLTKSVDKKTGKVGNMGSTGPHLETLGSYEHLLGFCEWLRDTFNDWNCGYQAPAVYMPGLDSNTEPGIFKT